MHRILSTHCDDAALSLGAFLSVEPGVVTTIFAGIPQEFGAVTDYDRARGFETSTNAMLERRREDQAALAILGCVAQHAGYLDRQYREGEPDVDRIIETIRGLTSPDVHLFAPLGIGHPDHALLAKLVRLACPPEIIVYHDLPYCALWPEQVGPALEEIRAEGWRMDEEPWPLPQGDLATKEWAIREYRSQYPDGPDHACLIQEKAWRFTR